MDDAALSASSLRLVILIPVRDDWTPAAELLRRLDRAMASTPHAAQVLLVDDGSMQDYRTADLPSHFAALRGLRILRLRRNLGHQRAIAAGLTHIEGAMPCDAVLVMDGDGEDTPEGALQLLREFTGKAALFARRTRRTESLSFRLSYRAYKALYRGLTGMRVQVGNFSILPASYLRTLATMPEMWNHYVAAVKRSRLPFAVTPIPRGRRIAGQSKMNFLALMVHGLSSIAVFGDVVGARMIVVSLTAALLASGCLCAAAALRFLAHWAVPGWIGWTAAALLMVFLQCAAVAAAFTLTILSQRSHQVFLPQRDCAAMIEGFEDIVRCDRP